MQLNVSISTPPATVAYDLDKIKGFLRVSGAGDDDALTLIADAAIDTLGDYLGIAFISSGFTWNIDAFLPGRSPTSDFWYNDRPSGDRLSATLRVPYGPLVSVTSVKYKDNAGALVTWSGSNYQIDQRLGRIAPAPTVMWPTIGVGYFNPIEIIFTAGYADPTAIPDRLLLGLYQLIGHWFENREAFQTYTLSDVPVGIFNIIDEFKR